ncbi:hypothetical protein JZ751_017016 [Albula glossodonta]|uniref:Uncharacterized protein n=1 Tax=Albula glossodonta TaxID=121402 RepID=A0A8T2MUJ5_9TELE|nr:hypothetical protein JZ751_017016 [Albula glossodonta]
MVKGLSSEVSGRGALSQMNHTGSGGVGGWGGWAGGAPNWTFMCVWWGQRSVYVSLGLVFSSWEYKEVGDSLSMVCLYPGHCGMALASHPALGVCSGGASVSYQTPVSLSIAGCMPEREWTVPSFVEPALASREGLAQALRPALLWRAVGVGGASVLGGGGVWMWGGEGLQCVSLAQLSSWHRTQPSCSRGYTWGARGAAGSAKGLPREGQATGPRRNQDMGGIKGGNKQTLGGNRKKQTNDKEKGKRTELSRQRLTPVANGANLSVDWVRWRPVVKGGGEERIGEGPAWELLCRAPPKRVLGGNKGKRQTRMQISITKVYVEGWEVGRASEGGWGVWDLCLCVLGGQGRWRVIVTWDEVFGVPLHTLPHSSPCVGSPLTRGQEEAGLIASVPRAKDLAVLRRNGLVYMRTVFIGQRRLSCLSIHFGIFKHISTSERLCATGDGTFNSAREEGWRGTAASADVGEKVPLPSTTPPTLKNPTMTAIHLPQIPLFPSQSNTPEENHLIMPERNPHRGTPVAQSSSLRKECRTSALHSGLHPPTQEDAVTHDSSHLSSPHFLPHRGLTTDHGKVTLTGLSSRYDKQMLTRQVYWQACGTCEKARFCQPHSPTDERSWSVMHHIEYTVKHELVWTIYERKMEVDESFSCRKDYRGNVAKFECLIFLSQQMKCGWIVFVAGGETHPAAGSGRFQFLEQAEECHIVGV